MTGNINTGRIDYKTDRPRQNAYPRFEKDLRQVLDWKQDSDRFIDDLLGEGVDMEGPYNAIVESLKRSRTGRTLAQVQL